MDKIWMCQPRSFGRYLDGLNKFLDFAFSNAAQGDQILCSCKNCNNCCWSNRAKVCEHLICDGFNKIYDKWIFIGEGGSSKVDKRKTNMHDNLDELLEDTFMMSECDFDDILDEDEEFDVEMVSIYNLVRDARQEAYPSCKKFSKLSIIVRLLHIKNLYGWSDVSFSALLLLLKELHPENSSLPVKFQD